MVENLVMSSFHNNVKIRKISPVAPDMSQTVHKDLV
jgi:hypothetical protein